MNEITTIEDVSWDDEENAEILLPKMTEEEYFFCSSCGRPTEKVQGDHCSICNNMVCPQCIHTAFDFPLKGCIPCHMKQLLGDSERILRLKKIGMVRPVREKRIDYQLDFLVGWWNNHVK